MSKRSATKPKLDVTWLAAGALVALPLLAAFVAPRVFESWAAVMGAGVAVLCAAGVAVAGQVRPSRQVLVVVGVSGGAVLWLAVRSAFALNPRVSLLGMLGAGDGALLWLMAWVVFASAALMPGTRALKAVRATLAVAGAVAAIAGLMDLAGVIPHPDNWAAEAAGLMGTSNSLGQLLIVGLGASVSWALAPSARRQGSACALICVAGLAATESRTALLAALVAGLAVAAVARATTPRARAGVAAGAGAVLGVAAAGTMIWSATTSSPAVDTASRLLSDRPALWRAAFAQIAQAPVAGSGNQMFSAYYTWSIDAQRLTGVDAIGTFSPHSLALDWLLAGGIVGALLALGALGVFVAAVAPPLASAPRTDPVWPLLAGLTGWLIAALVGIVEAPALLAVCALSGALLAATSRREAPAQAQAGAGGGALAVAASAALIGIAAIAVLVPVTASGARAFAWDPSTVGPQELPRYTAAYQHTGDPVYATMGLTALLGQSKGDYPDQLAADARALARLAARDASWQVSLASLGAAAEGLRSAEDSATQFARVEVFLDKGQAADPASLVWDYLRKRETERLGVTR